MQALIGKDQFRPERPDLDYATPANRAVSIGKAVLDDLEARRAEWIGPNYPRT